MILFELNCRNLGFMRKSYVFLLIILAISTGVIVSTMSSTESYAPFSEAFDNQGQDYTVVGNLLKEKQIVYNPKINPNIVSFYMTDKQGKTSKVILNQSKPQDMERSEDIVIKGRAQDSVFYAHTILLKCPSKYEEQAVAL